MDEFSGKKPARILFMGTPEFASAALRAVHSSLGVHTVITLPDKPAGRGLHLQPTHVKQTALELDLPVLTPASLKDPEFQSQIASLQPDIMVIVAFRILPRSLYSLARLGAFNVHASLLPAYRGAAPINWAIINGEKHSGVTTFLLNDTVDTGNVLLRRECAIEDGMTAGDLYQRLMPIGAEMAVETCAGLINGNLIPIAQDESKASPAPKLFREQCKVDFSLTAGRIRNFIHGVNPTPGAWAILAGKRFKFLRAELSTVQMDPGTFHFMPDGLMLGCTDSPALCITEFQPEGKPPMNAENFMRGYRGIIQGVIE
jgi:methionyl-tRNA formyltransferase